MRKNLNAAFREMRKAGLIAHQNYLCCGSCAGNGIVNKTILMIDKDATAVERIKGCCYYHRQDTDRRNRGKNFMLNFGVIDTSEYGEIGLPTKSVGGLVCEILTMHHVPFEWDGNPNHCIEIIQELP